MNKLMLALPLFALSVGTNANVRVGDGIIPDYARFDNTAPNLDISKMLSSKSSIVVDQYVVTLADQPLATYDGGLNGYAGTSRLGSKNSNITAKGL